MTISTPQSGRRLGRRLLAVTASLGLAVGLVAAGTGGAQAATAWADNPKLNVSCGLDVVLVLDQSSSIAASGAEAQVKGAANTLLQSFKDTNTRVGIVTFATTGTAKVGLTYATSSTVTPTGSLGAAVASYKANGADTNWQDGLVKAKAELTAGGKRANVQQLVILVTDGAPNAYDGAGGKVTLVPGYPGPNAIAVTAAQDPANAIKAGGARILAMGVGSNFAPSSTYLTQYLSWLELVTQTTVAPTNIPASIAGPTDQPNPLANPAANYPPFDPTRSDILVNPDFTVLGDKFAAVAAAVCDSSLTIQHVGNSATSPYASTGLPGWTSSVAVDTAIDWTLPTTASASVGPETATSNAVGNAIYQWSSAITPWTRTATITLSQKANYTLTSFTCNKGGLTPTGTPGQYTVTVGGGQVTCTATSKYSGLPQASISMSPRAVTKVYGSTKTLVAGTLTRPNSKNRPVVAIPGAVLKLQQSTDGGTTWTTIASRVTTSTGATSAYVTPTVNTRYRWYYKSTIAKLLGNYSPTLTFSVPAKVSLAVNKQNVAKGTTVVFGGTVAPSHKYQGVQLQRLVGRTWKTVKTANLDRFSRFSISWKTDSSADYSWRVLKTGDSRNSTAASNVVKLIVK